MAVVNNTQDMLKLNTVMVDYLRITSFDLATFQYIEDVLHKLQESQGLKKGSVDARLMQYEGYRIENLALFIGQGVQSKAKGSPKQPHYMLDVAGAFAHDMYEGLTEMAVEGYYEYRVPRIDVQKSMTQERFKQIFGIDEGTMFRFLVNSIKEDWFGPKPRVEYTSDLSVGLGNRKSGMFRRIYLKQTVEPPIVRFETEFHNDMAYQVFTGNLEGLFGKSWTNFPKRYNLSVLAVPEPVDWARKKSNAESRIAWLNSTIFPMLTSDMASFDESNGTKIAFHVEEMRKVIERAYYKLGRLADEPI